MKIIFQNVILRKLFSCSIIKNERGIKQQNEKTAIYITTNLDET